MLIYKHTCTTTGLSYIGQTINTMQHRLKSHICESKSPKYDFHKAIKRYGIENFTSEILIEGITNYKILDIIEMYYIFKFNTYKNGYNMTPGGNSTSPKQVENMMKTRFTLNESGISNYQLGGIRGAKTKKTTILQSGQTLMQEIVEKGKKTREKRGDYKKLSEKMKGKQFGQLKVCEHCGLETMSGNYKRWHGDNCKMNSNITKEQLNKRSNGNEGIIMLEETKKKISNKRKNMISAFNLETKEFCTVTREEFKLEKYVGTTNKKVKECLNKNL